MKRNKKILLVLSAIIIIAGIIVTWVFGLNKGLDYSESKQVKIYLATDVNVEEIRQITDEVFGSERVILQKVELFNDEISITTKNISEEQLTKLVELTNQKYGLENKASEVNIITISGVNVLDTIIPYIVPIIIALVLIVIYMAIKYKGKGIFKVIFSTLGIVVLIEAIYYSLIAITRIPINRYTMPIGLAILLITLTTLVYNFEKGD